MDVHLLNAPPSDEERAAVDACLGPPSSAWDGGQRGQSLDSHVAFGGAEQRARRHLLLPALEAVQARVGWVSEGALDYICARLDVPPAEAWGVATFYALLATTPRPRRVLHICDDIGCKCRGADTLVEALTSAVGPAHSHGPEGDHLTIDPGGAVWMRSPCLGLCDLAPAALVTDAGDEPTVQLMGGMTASRAQEILAGSTISGVGRRHKIPQLRDPSLRLLKRVDSVDPTSLTDYRATGGYQALARALDMGSEAIIREVTDSKLLGRGGAAFPTGRKWQAVASQAARPHYLICNADESEPGTFKDRVLLEGDPFAIVEAMTIAGIATGCEQGYLYLRGEYPLARHRMEHAIEAARTAGFLGDNILRRRVRFDIEVRSGAGAYICGEETAIFNSIEGYRGEPRNKPPFPVQAGLFGKPTLVNNVETLANIPYIVINGGRAFAAIGTEGSTGTRLFCVSGDVQRPGTYEVAFGATLRDLYTRAGGVGPGRTLQAILLGGAAGVFVRPDELDMVLTFEGVRAAKATLGSGVIMAFDDTVDLRAILRRIAAFFRDESCGQCVPCRVGTVRQEEALHRIMVGKPRGGLDTEVDLLREVGAGMTDASICGLGQTAYAAVESAIHRLHLFNGATRGTA
ncbi:MAG TPA: NAD(P)H-dependent oxidoreductase subunit E [Gemmatimonadaceae bacterium]|nr:NAD(P)H-dependent oxidoreductase subunit E [Gemmatimonadaceae bacterium]